MVVKNLTLLLSKFDSDISDDLYSKVSYDVTYAKSSYEFESILIEASICLKSFVDI